MENKVDINGFLSRKRLTQQQLADIINVPRSRVAQWCCGRCEITRKDCALLLKEGMTIAECFGEEVAKIVVVDSLQSPENSLDKKKLFNEFLEILREKLQDIP